MADLTKTKMKELAKQEVFTKLKDILYDMGGEQYGDFNVAIPVEINGAEIWVAVNLVAKQWYDTDSETPNHFDVFIEKEEWEFKLKERQLKKERAERKKAEKIAKQKERAERRKAKEAFEKAQSEMLQAEIEKESEQAE